MECATWFSAGILFSAFVSVDTEGIGVIKTVPIPCINTAVPPPGNCRVDTEKRCRYRYACEGLSSTGKVGRI